MNCMNNIGFPNQNIPMQGMNIGGAWKNLYDINNQANMQNIIQNKNDRAKGRVNVVFRTTRGIKIIIFIELGKLSVNYYNYILKEWIDLIYFLSQMIFVLFIMRIELILMSKLLLKTILELVQQW